MLRNYRLTRRPTVGIVTSFYNSQNTWSPLIRAYAGGKRTTPKRKPRPQNRIQIPNTSDGRNFTRDPLALAATVQTMVREGKDEDALFIVQKAGTMHGVNTLPIWNAIIRGMMDEGQIDKALKIFNDMKKRGRRPDKYTYKNILIGISNSTRIRAQHLEIAMNLYQNMCDSKETKPEASHSNTVLQIARKAGSIETMWSILSKMPDGGRHAADTATYTIMLKGISELGEDEDIIPDCKRVWAGALSQWSKGVIDIDDGLASTMMFQLVKVSKEELRNMSLINKEYQLEAIKIAEQIFGLKLLDPPTKHNPPTPNIPPPVSERVLIPLLKAAENIRDVDLAQHIWKTFISPPYNIKPVTKTFHQYLYIFQTMHDPQGAVSALKENKDLVGPYTSMTYSVAMRSCFGGNRGPQHSRQQADLIFDMAEASDKKNINTKFLQAYLDAALGSRDPGFIKTALTRFMDYSSVGFRNSEGSQELVHAVHQCLRNEKLVIDPIPRKAFEDWIGAMRSEYAEAWEQRTDYVSNKKGMKLSTLSHLKQPVEQGTMPKRKLWGEKEHNPYGDEKEKTQDHERSIHSEGPRNERRSLYGEDAGQSEGRSREGRSREGRRTFEKKSRF
ncbi:hypothetical protein EDC01DRAFT_664768 [Geopyxis carbonaria]|nr:hypothetical protein EDC01DRAFT_664768 [Geopyxis carbonaria]